MTLSGTPDPVPVDAVEIVTSQFKDAATFVDIAYDQLQDAINDLAGYDPGYSTFNVAAFDVDIAEFSGNYVFPSIPSPPDLVASFPTVPTRPELGTIPSVVIPETPVVDIPVFDDAFAYAQTRYITDNLEDFRTRLAAFIADGGTGLAAVVEQAIYDRDVRRQETSEAKAFQEIQDFHESRGNSMPSGTHIAALNSESKERARRRDEISNNVMIQASNLEQENMRIAQDSLIKVDTILVTLHGTEEERELQTETTRITTGIEIYNAYLRGVLARLEAHKITVDSLIAYITANVETIKANALVYGADVSAYVATVDAEAKQLGATADIYRANVGGVEAAIRGIAALVDVDIAQYKVQSDIAVANAQNQLGVQRLNLESRMKRIDTRVEQMRAIAAVSAQVVASSLNSVSTSASIGQSSSSSFSHAYEETKAVDAGTTEAHTFYTDLT